MKSQLVTCRGFAGIVLHSLLMALPLGAGETVVDDSLGFTLTLPDGFVLNTRLANAPPDIVHSFVLDDPTDGALDIMLFVEKMNRTIGRERLKLEDLPPGFQGRLFTTRWQAFEVDAFEVPEKLGDINTVTLNAQIPLKRAAIQIKLFGPVDKTSEMKALLPEILAGLQGESNWIRSAAPNLPLASSEHYGTVLLAIAVIFILVGFVVLYVTSRYAPKGTVLAISAAIYCIAFALAGVRVREFLMLSGALKMLGIAGGILGVVDIVRKRRPRVQDNR